MAPLLQERDRFLVRQIVRDRESIDPRRHAILRRLVAELDDFLDHLALGFLERAFLLAHLDQRLEFLVADCRPHAQIFRREPVDHQLLAFSSALSDAIEQRHHHLEREHAHRRDSVGGRDREQFRDQIAEHNDDGENRRASRPTPARAIDRTFPNEDEAENDQRHVDERVAEEENVEDAPRVVAEEPEEIGERGMLFVQALDLVAFQREERRLQPGKKRRAGDQEDDRAREDVSPTAVIRAPRPCARPALLCENSACSVAGHLCGNETKLSVNKDQRISRLVEELSGAPAGSESGEIAEHPCYTGFFRCWNEQRYYEAHDVLEHLWLRTKTEDANYFKGLIQAAGGFVHLQKQHARPTHPKDGRRMYPAVRLFRLAEKNLQPFAPRRHRFAVDGFLRLLRRQGRRDSRLRSPRIRGRRRPRRIWRSIALSAC